jgi:hypothetical protein
VFLVELVKSAHGSAKRAMPFFANVIERELAGEDSLNDFSVRKRCPFKRTMLVIGLTIGRGNAFLATIRLRFFQSATESVFGTPLLICANALDTQRIHMSVQVGINLILLSTSSFVAQVSKKAKSKLTFRI